MASIEEALTFDISAALSSVDQLDAALSAVASNFTAAMNDASSAIGTVTIDDVDTSAVTSSIDDAVAASGAVVPVEADASAVTGEIDSAVDAADTTVVIEADASGVTGAIDEAVGSAEGGGVSQFTTAAALANASAAALRGSGTGAATALGSITTGATAAAGALSAGAGAFGLLIDAAADAEAAEKRFTLATGKMGDQIRQVDIGGLNEDLTTLAVRTGNSDEKLLDASARAFRLAQASGAGADQAALYAEQLEVLSVRAAELNPKLGEAGEVSDRLTRILATGRPAALIPYGITLDATAVKAHAVALGLAETEDQVTKVQASVAGADLAFQGLSDAAGDIAKASDTTQNRVGVLKQRIDEAMEAAGKPLLPKFAELLDRIAPAVETLAQVVGLLGVPAIEALQVSIEPLLVSLKLLDEFLSFVGLGVDNLKPPLDEQTAAVKEADKAFQDYYAHLVTGTDGPLIDVRDTADGVAGALARVAERTGDISQQTQAEADALKSFSDVLTSHLSGIDRALSALKPNQGLKSFVNSLEAETKRTADFVNAIDELVRRGATSLAALLAQEGPDALRPAQQAAALRGDLLRDRETQASKAIEIDQKAIAQQAALAPKLLAAVTDPLAKDGGTEIGKAIAKATAAAAPRALAAGHSIGEGLGHGAAVGVQDTTPEVITATINMILGVQDAVGAHSPARLAEDKAGIPIGQGITHGAAKTIATGTDERDGPVAATKKMVEKMGAAGQTAAADIAKRLFDIQGPATATGKALDLLGPAKLAGILAEFRSGNVTLAEFNRLLAQTGLSSDTLLDVLSETKDAMRAFTDDAVSGLASLEDALNGVKENESLDDFLLRIRQDTVKTAQFLKDINTLVARGADDLAAALLEAGINAAFAAREAAGLSATTLAARERQLEGLELADARNIAGGQRIGSSLAGNAGPNAVGGKIVNQRITVNEVANDPDATARAVSARLAADGTS